MTKTNTKTEIIAGCSTFLAAMYIIVVNPAILSQTGMPFSAVLTATVLLSFVSSVMMGLYAKNPIVVAPGMGMNAFFTFTAVKTMGLSYQTALGCVFWAGITFLLLSIFNIREAIIKSIPRTLRLAISAGIGLFIALIGFENAKFIVSNPATLISIGNLHEPATIVFLVGLTITSILLVKKTKAAIIIGIILTTFLAWTIGRYWGNTTIVNWQGVWARPDFSLIFQLDLVGSLKFSLLPVIFAFVFTDLFDSLSTFLGLAEASNLKDENGEPLRVKQSLLTDAVATTLGGILGTSPGTAFIESAVGIAQGGRTGLTAITAGILFLPFMFLSPLLSMIPAIATAPALILVGVFMVKPITNINWEELDEAIPAFLAIVLIPFSYSITQGIIFGFLSWTILKVALGKSKEISTTLWIIDFFAIVSIIL